MKNKKVIALTGYARCGKNFLATILKERYEAKGLSVEEFAYADVLKEIVSMFINEPIEKIDELKNSNEKICIHNEQIYVRDFLTIIANGIKNGMSSYFSDVILDRVRISDADIVIITDLRFTIEHAGLKDTYPSSCIVRVTRDHKSCRKRIGDVEVDHIPYDIKFEGVVSDSIIEKLMTNIDSIAS